MTPLKTDETPDKLEASAEQQWLLETDTLDAALRLFDRSGRHRLPIVAPTDRQIVIGWADHFEALHAFNKALIESHREEHR
ncbi:MAG: hypothetical protein AAFQ35_13230 [Pseudomonadota bacterium]